MTYEIQTHALIVKPKNAPLYSEQATIIRLEDEGAGYYVAVEQHDRTDIGKIAITPEEWPTLREAIDRLMALYQPKAVYRCNGNEWDGKGDKPQWMRDWIAAGNDPWNVW